MMKKTLRHGLTVAMAVLLLFSMLLPLTAQAAVAPPDNAYWSGKTACWSPSPDDGISYYIVEIYKDGDLFDAAYPAGWLTSLDVSGLIDSNPGTYQFRVAAATGSDASEKSSFVYSEPYTFGEEHKHVMVHVPFHYPTCTEKGCKGYYVCSDCGKWFMDASGSTEITNHDDAFTDAIGHSWGEWKTVKEATETEDGKMERVCSNDSDHVETKVIPKTGSKTESTTAKQAETKPTEKKPAATTAPATTAPASTTKPTDNKSTTAPTLIATEPTTNGGIGGGISGGFGKWLGSNLLFAILIAAAAFLLLVAVPLVIILIVVLNKKKKRAQNPPMDPQGGNRPPMNPQQGNRPPVNPQQGNRPPMNPQQGNRPPMNPQQGNRPPMNPQQGNRPPMNPQQTPQNNDFRDGFNG